MPAAAGPAADAMANAALSRAFPSRSARWGSSSVATAAREMPRPVSASVPSANASTSTAASANVPPAMSARPAKASASST